MSDRTFTAEEIRATMGDCTPEEILTAVGECFHDQEREFDGKLSARDDRLRLMFGNQSARIDEVKKVAVAAHKSLDRIKASRQGKPSLQSILIKSLNARLVNVARRGDMATTLKQLYPHNERVVKAVSSPAMTTVGGWAQELVGNSQTYGIVGELAPNSVYSNLQRRGISVSLAGMSSMRFLSRPTPASIPDPWVGEGLPIPARQLDFSKSALMPHKVATFSLFSGEVARYSTPAAEALIGQCLSDDLELSVDKTLLDANPATATRPAGLLNGVAALPASTSLQRSEAMLEDISALAAAFVPGAKSLVIICGSSQSAALMLAYPGNAVDIIETDVLAAGTVVAVDASDFACVVGENGGIDVSNDSTVELRDDPQGIATGSSGPGAITSAPVQSVWQHDLIAIRCLEDTAWEMARPGRVAWIDGTKW